MLAPLLSVSHGVNFGRQGASPSSLPHIDLPVCSSPPALGFELRGVTCPLPLYPLVLAQALGLEQGLRFCYVNE